MLKVILTKGLPGSGKSTWAFNQLENNPGKYKRINKDDLRAMLDKSRWSNDNEKFVLKVRDQLILMALEEGKHVIIDDTNFASKHIERIKQLVKGKAEIIIQDFTDVPLEVCIKNDLTRFNSVGKDVIMKMYNQYLKPKPETPKEGYGNRAIIVDMDGTLALLNGRNPYDASTCENDLLNTSVANIVNTYAENGRTIIICSGREEQYRQQTINFLHKYSVPWNFLYMRPSEDYRKDAIIKKEMYENHINGKFNVEFVLDDRNQVVDLWRSLGLTCLQVAEGDF